MIIEVSYLDSKQKEKFETSKLKCIIGRSKNADIWVNREELSRAHLQIELQDKDFFITDLNSTNGVIINGERIPADVRIAYKNIFPIEIGDKISIQVFYETVSSPEEDEAAAPIFKSTLRHQNRQEFENNKTTVSKHQKNAHSKNMRPVGENKSSPMLKPLLLVGAIGLAVFYHYKNKDEVVIQAPLIAPTATQAVVPVVPPLKVSEIDFKGWLGKNQCDRFGNLCSTLELTRAKEMILLQDNKLLVYVNVGDYVVENAAREFNELKEVEKTEYILANIGTHPALLEMALNKKPTHLLIVGFSSVEDITVMKNVLNVNYAAFPQIDLGYQKGFFSNIFYGAIFRDYKRFFKKHLDLQPL